MTRIGLCLSLLLLLCACAFLQPTPSTPEPVIEAKPTQTPTAPQPKTPSHTPTATPTPKPTSTNTPTPTAPPPEALSMVGPWAIILNQGGIWITNVDGSALTHLSQDVVPHRNIAVAGKWLAYITENAPDVDGGLVLRVLALPDGEPQTVSTLDIPNVTSDSSDDLQFAAQQVYNAVVFENGSFAWSPDGAHLAFISGHDGVAADVYLYTPDTGTIARLTEHPSHAYQLSWSPDGQHVFHTGASNFGSGAGYEREGVWAVRADGTSIRSLYTPESRTGAEELVAWIAPDTALVNAWRPDCGGHNLVVVNVASGALDVVWPHYFNRLVYNADTGEMLINAMDIDCNPESASGFYRVEAGGTQPESISYETFEALLPEPPPDPIPAALRQELEAQFDVQYVLWVQP